MTPATMPNAATLTADIQASITGACDHIAPSWPLDRLIAVNPFWGFVNAPIEQAAAELTALSGATLLMPRSWYREQLEAGRFSERHVAQAIAVTGAGRTVAQVMATVAHDASAPAHLRLMTDAADVGRDLGHAMPWIEYVTRHISQTCAAFFDEGQARWTPDREDGLYPLWRELALHDGGPRLLMKLHGFREAAAALPRDPHALIAEALRDLEVPPELREQYLTALLLSINGWASVCAFRRWEARLASADDAQLVHLLAVRIAWELLLRRLCTSTTTSDAWRAAKAAWTSAAPAAHDARRDDWLLQRACEIAYHETVTRALVASMRTPLAPRTATSAQAVFCIDVRSEVFRRALEQVAPSVQTLGFAGFFGLPIAYQPLSGPARAQLPGLLAPGMIVEDAGPARASATDDARTALGDGAAWKSLGGTAASAFSFVEATGIAAATKLVKDGFGLGSGAGDTLRPAASHGSLRPELARLADGSSVTDDARVALATGILRAMSLTSGFAPLLALIGHGASTENNPLAAGLHCGACGGQTGEVNARALAALLNDAEVRGGLAGNGIDLGETHVVAGLHDTTTDEITLYDLDRVPASHRANIDALQAQFAAAGIGARRERATSLGLSDLSDDVLDRAVRHRSRDWAEVRPEWGLAGNAAFIVAPRERTKSIDLQGRSFLHEYDWRQDATFGVLELIMTAPMVVTHWINLQYYASVVDPLHYGSGNKVLHNVVGGRIGVMEGAGGDLRIGLAMQSVHDGERWVHEPLRLSVFIEAPADAIDGVIAKHVTVRQLVEHDWLFLHRIDPDSGVITQRRRDGWFTFDAD